MYLAESSFFFSCENANDEYYSLYLITYWIYIYIYI